jgi:outer membrane protein TolC
MIDNRRLACSLLATLLTAWASPAVADRAEKLPVVEDDGIDTGIEGIATFEVTLDQLIDATISGSPELARSKSDRDIAKGKAGAARADQQWIAKVDLTYDRFSVGGDVDEYEVVEPQSVVDQRQFKSSLTLGRNIPTGGNVSVQLGFERNQFEVAVDPAAFDLNPSNPNTMQVAINEFYAKHRTNAVLAFKQPLGRGFGPDVALANQKRADLQMTEATLKTQLEAERIIQEVVTGYWELAYSYLEVQIRQEGLAAAQAHEKDTKIAVRANMQPPREALAVALEVAQREEAVMKAQLDYEKKSLELRRKTGISLDQREVVLRPTGDFAIGTEDFNVEDVLAQSRKVNRKLAQLILQKKQAELDVKVAKNQTLPQIDVSLQGGVLGQGDSVSSSLTGAGSADGFQLTANLSVQFDISGAAKSNLAAAEAQKARVEVDRIDQERTLETEVVQSVRLVKSSAVRVELARKAVTAAVKNVEAENVLYQSRGSSNSNVAARRTDEVEARIREARAIADYQIQVAALKSITGTILGEYGVDVRPGGK